ncbi:MAG TPA: RNA polymerase sigma factor [Candidatus Kapabacteria bacterium]|nr:RNA polymerase sigma factor [Candidatus Kapabacteria bacterium]
MTLEHIKHEETELLHKVFAGDDGAFHLLYARYNKKLTIFAAKMLCSRERANDLAQEVWMRVIEQRKKPQEIEHVGAYLFRIARNLSLDAIRKDRGHTPLDDVAEEQHPSAATSGERTELEEIVLLALDSLSPDDKELLVMHTYLGYGYDEIAEMQSKSPEAIWTRASRARTKLRTIVQAEAARLNIEIITDRKQTTIKRERQTV